MSNMASLISGGVHFLTLFGQFKLIRCGQLFFRTSTTYFLYRSKNSYRFLPSISPCRSRSDDSKSVEETNNVEQDQDEKAEQRVDLEKIKELLFQRKYSTPVDSDTSSSVDVNKIKDALSVLKRSSETNNVEQDEKAEKLPDLKKKEELLFRKKHSEPVYSDTSPSEDVNKLKDALSVLKQDSSRKLTEDVMLAGAEHSKRSSLRTGPRLHWFDEVRDQWSHAEPIPESIFQEQAQKELQEIRVGNSTSAQSGFRHFIENIHRQWAFPIDNESCKADEQDVGFEEHVFLEHCLDEFPKNGNIREFMELVITGLQQNPHLSIQEKVEHIVWFKEYFKNVSDEQVQL